MGANIATDLTPVCSREAEQATIGGLLNDDEQFATIDATIKAGDFYYADHRLIFGAIARLRSKGLPADTVTVADALGVDLDRAGGLAYLGKLVRDTPTAENVSAYAGAVVNRARLRALQKMGDDVARACAERGQSAPDLIARAITQLLELQATARSGRGLVDSRQLAGELLDDLDRRVESARGLPLGLQDLDDLTCGLEPGDLVVIAARPGMGKTALMVTIGATVSQSNSVAIFSAEMPSAQLMRRCVALLSNVSQGKLRRAERLTDDDWGAIAPAAAAIAERRLWIDDASLPTLAHVRSECMALKARSGLGLAMVDYCQLVQGSGANRYEQLRDVAYGAKALAKELRVPVILLAQLNREVESRENKRPHIADLRDSGAIEEAADIVGRLRCVHVFGRRGLWGIRRSRRRL
jgi:replicative DNA helicase